MKRYLEIWFIITALSVTTFLNTKDVRELKRVVKIEQSIDTTQQFKPVPRKECNLPTRLNNPGALRPCSNPKVMQYSEGIYTTPANGKFLRFATPQEGFFALEEVINSYNNCSLKRFLKRYAPKQQDSGMLYQNDTKSYLSYICGRLGVKPSTKVKDCNKGLLMESIAIKEGFKNIKPKLEL